MDHIFCISTLTSQLSQNFDPWALIPHLCCFCLFTNSQFCIDVMATRSYGFRRTTMWRMRSSTAQRSSPPLDMYLTAGSSHAHSSCPLHCSNFVCWQKASKEKKGKKQTLISWLLCLCTAGHIISWWNRTLKVKQQRLPSSPSFFVLVPHLWNCSLLVACSLPLLQLITSSSSINCNPGLVKKHKAICPAYCVFSDAVTRRLGTEMDMDWVCVVFLSALKEMKMESGGRNSEPFGLAKLSFHGTRLWMLSDGYVFCLCCQVKKDLKWLLNLTRLKAVIFAVTSWSQLTIMCYCLCIYLHKLITSSPHFKVRLTCELSN